MAMQTAESGPVRYGPTEWNSDRLTATTTTTTIGYRHHHNHHLHQTGHENSLPKDPRAWSRQQVIEWVNWVMLEHGLPQVPDSRFLMNGKALCLMSLSMFLIRVPLGGKLLYKDFQLRLCAALYQPNNTM